MKNICIVLCNKRNTIGSLDFTAVTDAFFSGGIFFNQVLLLSYDEVKELHENISKHIQSADFLCVMMEDVLLQSVRENLSKTFSLTFEDDVCTKDKCLFALLPVGKNGKDKVKNSLLSKINAHYGNRYDKMVIRMVGVPSEKINEVIRGAYEISGDQLIYNFTDHYDDQRLEAIYDAVTPKMTADAVMRYLLENLYKYVYSVDDISLEQRVYDCLSVRKKKLSVAESFTGGGISSRLTSVSGISAYYVEGLNTYANSAKTDRLGVKEFTLKQHGAVSEQTAYEMAEGLLLQGNCDICVATTGIAGPNSDNTKKPVGLCYISYGLDQKIYVEEHHFTGDRTAITQKGINHALFALYKLLK